MRPDLLLQLFVWTGALVFVGSLSYFAYFFATITPGPPTAGAGPAVLTNLSLFTLFAAHHSVMARSGANLWLSTHLAPRLERSAYVWTASLLFIVTLRVVERPAGYGL